MRNMLREALKQWDFSEDANILARAAKSSGKISSTMRDSDLQAVSHQTARKILYQLVSNHLFQ